MLVHVWLAHTTTTTTTAKKKHRSIHDPTHRASIPPAHYALCFFAAPFWSKSFEFLNTRGRISSLVEDRSSAHALLNSPPCRPSTTLTPSCVPAAAHNNEALASHLIPTGNPKPCGLGVERALASGLVRAPVRQRASGTCVVSRCASKMHAGRFDAVLAAARAWGSRFGSIDASGSKLTPFHAQSHTTKQSTPSSKEMKTCAALLAGLGLTQGT